MISRTPAHPIDRMPKLISNNNRVSWMLDSGGASQAAEISETINRVREMTRGQALVAAADLDLDLLIVMLDARWLIVSNDSTLASPA